MINFVKNIKMTTLIVKINERTKAGKAFMAMAEIFFKDAKGIEIIKNEANPVVKTVAKISKNIPNTETQKAIHDAVNGIGLTRSTSHKDLMKKLLSILKSI